MRGDALAHRRGLVLRYVLTGPPEGVTTRQLADGLCMSRDNAYADLRALQRAGEVEDYGLQKTGILWRASW